MELFFILSILLTSSCTISRFIILHDMHENYSMLNSEELIHFDQWKYMIPFYNLYLYHNHIPLLEEEKEKYLFDAYRTFQENQCSLKRTGAYEWEQDEEQFIEVKPTIKTICIKGNEIQLFVNSIALENTMLLIPNKNDYRYEMDDLNHQMNLIQLQNQTPLYVSCKKDAEYRFLIQAKQFLLDYQIYTLENNLQEVTEETIQKENLMFSFQKTK